MAWRVVRAVLSSKLRVDSFRGEGPASISDHMVSIIACLLENVKIMKIVGLGLAALLMLVLSAVLAVTSAPAFELFHLETQEWYNCIKTFWAQRNVYGDDAWDDVLASSVRNPSCVQLGKNGPSAANLTASFLAETVVPLLIAFFFGGLPLRFYLKKFLVATD